MEEFNVCLGYDFYLPKLRKCSYQTMSHLGGPAIAFPIVNSINQGSVVPVLDYVVRPQMEPFFCRVSAIIK